MSQDPIPTIPGLEYLNLFSDEDDEQPSSPLPPAAHSPRLLRAINPEDWISTDIGATGNISIIPRQDIFGFPLQIFRSSFGQNRTVDVSRNPRSASVLEYSPALVTEYSPDLENLGESQRPQQIQLSPIPIPLALEHNPAVEQMINDLNEIESAESQLLNQMRQLEQAHSQLERARTDLINALVRLEYHESQNHRNEDEDGYNEEEEDEEDAHDQFLTDLFNARLQQRHQEHRLGIPRYDQNLLDFEMFLDVNGEPCTGFDDCLTRAVGWTGDIDEGLDRNGNEIDDNTPFSTAMR